VKVEEVSNVQEEEVPVPITWPTIKTEHEVSCVSVRPLVSRCNTYTELSVAFPISICLLIYPSI
jgi:hypothetical protein